MSDTSFSSTTTGTMEPPTAPVMAPPSPPTNLPSVHVGSSGSTVSAPVKPPIKSKPPAVRSGSTANLTAAVCAIMGEVGVIHKKGFNQFHKYKFVQMQDVLQVVTPLMARHGIRIVQGEVGRSTLDDGRVVAVEYEFVVKHISGEEEAPQKKTGTCRCRDSKGGFDDKSFNKCSTAAKKYFVTELFSIPTDDEEADSQPNVGPQTADGQSAWGKPNTPPRASTRARPAATPGADTDSRPDDGTYDALTGEIISGTPATDPHAGDVKDNAGAAAQPPAGSNGSQEVADLSQQEANEAADYQLSEAAKHGIKMLKTAWDALPLSVRQGNKGLRKALEERHKPTALAADQAERMKTGDFTNAA